MSETTAVAGYRQLTPEQVELANKNKLMEELILRQVEAVVATQGTDPRWAAVARTHIQEGFMALNRSIFQPTRLAGPIDAAGLFTQVSQ